MSAQRNPGSRSVGRLTLRVAVAAVLALAPALAPGLLVSSATAAPSRLASAVAGTPVSLAILVPLTVRPTATGLLDSATLATDTGPLGSLSRQLDAVYDTPAVIGIDPMIIASIQVLGTSAPASALAWLERLRSASNETFALAYADADLASLAQTGALDLASPLGFDFAIDQGHFGPAVTASPAPTGSAAPLTPTAPTPSPTPTSPSGPPPLPTTAAEVLAWSYTLQNIAWPADDTVTAADLEPLADAGYKDVVLSSSNVSATDSGSVDLSHLRGVISDSGISSLVRQAAYATSTAVEEDATARLNTALAGLEAVSPGRTVVATLDRHWPLTSLNLGPLFADLAGQTAAQLVGLSSVLAGEHPDARVVDEAGDPARAATLRSLLEANSAETQFATVAVRPELVLQPRRLALLSLLGVSWLRGTGDWNAEAATFLATSTALRDSVKIVTGSNLFVGAGHTNVPVTVSNAGTVPVTVYVTVSSPSSVLHVQKQSVALTVEPGSSNKAAIPVQALANGTVTTTVTIRTVSGLQLGDPDYVEVDLQPGWETVGTAVIVALLVLIFGGGITRNILKRRAARRGVPSVEPIADE